MATKKNPRIDRIVAAINKGYGSKVAAPLSRGIRSDIKEVIPTGLEVLDNYVLGIGGLPVGRMVELFSDEGVGKTSLLLQAIAGVQSINGVAILAETEIALEAKRAQVFGVNWDDVILLQPEHMTDLWIQAEWALKSLPGNCPALFGWDSVAATPSKEEVEQGLSEKEGYDKRAKSISRAMRVIAPLAARQRCAMLYINQIRAKIGVLFGPKTQTSGGYAMKFHSGIRLCLYPGKAIKGPGGQHLGKTVTIQAVKNKFTPPWRKGQFRLNYRTGWDNDWAVLRHAKELKLVKPRSQKIEPARAVLDACGWEGELPDKNDPFGEVEE